MCVILLRADNNGEGGTLALMALANARRGRAARSWYCSVLSAVPCSMAMR